MGLSHGPISGSYVPYHDESGGVSNRMARWKIDLLIYTCSTMGNSNLGFDTAMTGPGRLLLSLG